MNILNAERVVLIKDDDDILSNSQMHSQLEFLTRYMHQILGGVK